MDEKYIAHIQVGDFRDWYEVVKTGRAAESAGSEDKEMLYEVRSASPTSAAMTNTFWVYEDSLHRILKND